MAAGRAGGNSTGCVVVGVKVDRREYGLSLIRSLLGLRLCLVRLRVSEL